MMSIHLKEETVEYIPMFREYGIPVLDGGTSYIRIEYCPWCGKELPSSMSDKWFELMEEMQIDPADLKRRPKDMRSDAWWKKMEGK